MHWITMEFQQSYTWRCTWMPSGNFKVTVIMNGQRINRSWASCAFLCCSWVEQCSVHGWKYVSDVATTAVSGTAAVKSAVELGACLNHSALFSSDTVPWPLSTTQQLHLSINRHSNMEILLPKDMAFLPQSGPRSTSSYLLCCQSLPHSIFFICFSIHSRPCMTSHISRLCHVHPQWHRHTDTPPSPCI